MVLSQERSDWQDRPYALAAQERSDWLGASRIMVLSQESKRSAARLERFSCIIIEPKMVLGFLKMNTKRFDC